MAQLLGSRSGKKESESGSSSEPPISSIMQLVLDHEGNPEWKCLTCDFRDNEQETVIQHVRLAHGKKGPVSLLHAVHRCSVCGFAAGTKRHVQVHLETAHNGQGGIISRSEGQSIDPETGVDESNRSFDCRLCPFTCKKRGELKAHLSHHTPRVDFVFKCMFCPYYVATKSDLFNHLAVHGMNIPASVKEAVSENNTSAGIPTIINSASNDDASSRHFVCDLCPFETRSRAKLMHHRQFHRPRGLPFSCPHCSYNVTRRHLLAQHLRIHGVSPTEGLEIADNQGSKSKSFGDDSSFSRSKSPSPSLTITPISSGKDGDVAPSKIDPTCLPTLSDELTKNLHDIPLVWVSRDGRFFKMFKCRHCPHVNLRKTNIQEHEKMHRTDGLVPGTGHACQYCSYICINAGVMSAHLKVHSGSMGKCHAIVDQALPNEEQLHMLAGSAMKKAMAGKSVKQGDEKLLYYCQHCPGRFFFEKEVQIHSRFHQKNSNFTHHCPKCQFGARDESQILAHDKVHTTEYQERTRTLMSMHPAAPSFPPVQGLSVPQDLNKPVYGVPCSENDSSSSSKGPVNGFSRPWLSSPVTVNTTTSTSGNMPQPPPTSRFKCDQCPSTFSKLITLQYHQSLHSADNPFKCDRCTYAAKTQDGLQQHITLHEQADMEKESAKEEDSQKSSSPSNSAKKSLEETLSSLTGKKLKKDLMGSMQDSLDHPPIKLKLMKNSASSGNSKKQFKYYIEEQVPLSGVELLKRKNQIEREIPKDAYFGQKIDGVISCKSSRVPKAEDRCGNPNLHYPLHIDKSSGRTREKRYKCVRCPSAFEKLDQFNVHLNLHGSNYKYKCKICDYSVKFYANFMMHIKRHKYHERMDAQKKGLPLPPEDQMKYEPFIGDRPNYLEETRDRETFANDKENQFDFDAYPDMTTAEKQQIILQQKKADAFKLKDEDKDKKIFYCQYCPYANMRRDAVDSHSLRHQANMGRGVYQCNFCDYTASQPNFIREHTKVHFRPFKYVQSEGFMRHDKLEIWSIKSGELQDDDDTPKKMLVFGHEEGNFTPDFKESQEDIKPEAETETTSLESMDIVDSQAENGILVDFRSGDVVEAPSNFIIPLRPTKGNSKIVNGSGSGKCKSSKHMKARKKAKLSEPILDSVPQQKEENEEATKAENEEEEEDNGINKPELIKDESNALSPQEDTINNYNNSPSNSSSPATHNPENEEEAEANSDDPENENGDNCSGMEEVSPLKENYVTMTALSH
ncbi:Zinc finger protein 64-like protein, isoforms 3 and 4 [Armadillidium vulgare]|nr:Zinc finger protein 64-like protein, isoforms 3 and 4 [Armadillidium vulgare]